MNLSQLLTPPEGFGKALQTFSPLALAMAQGIRSGQGAQAYMPQGIAAMMANKDRADLDAKNEKLTGMLDTFGLTPAERALLDTMDLGGKQSYLANLIASRRTGGGGGRKPTEAEMAAEYLGQLGNMPPAGPSAASGLGFSTGTLVDGVTMPPSQPLSFGKTVPPAAIEQSTLPPAANDSWVFPSTFPNADPMAGSVVAQTPALASRPVPSPLSPQEAPPTPLSFGQPAPRPQAPALDPIRAELAQVDQRIMQAMREAQAGNVGAAAALKSLSAHRDMLVDMMPKGDEWEIRSVGDELVRVNLNTGAVQPLYQGEDGPLVDMSGATFGDGGESEYDKGRGKSFAERMNAYDADVSGAYGAIATLDQMETLMADPGFYSGTSGDSVLAAKRAARALGFDPEGVDSMEAFNTLAKRGALEAMGGSLGAGFSNADRDFVEAQVPRLANTPEGNRLIIQIQRKIQERRLQVAQMAQEYERRNGRLDAGFDDELRRFAESTPIFANPGTNRTSSGVTWSIVE